MDVLKYTALQENCYLNTQIGCYVANNATAYCAVLQFGPNSLNPNTAHCVALWKNIPGLRVSPASTLCVYNTSYQHCGASCTWTVPAGATLARFELWGAGSSNAPPNCCGYTPSGSSGSYVSFIMPVTPGCQYVLCAGNGAICCGYCGCISQTGACGSASYATGFGLTNVCAPGGRFNLNTEMCARLCSYGCTAAACGAAPTPYTWVHPCWYACMISQGACIGVCYCTSLCNTGYSTCLPLGPQADWEIKGCGTIANTSFGGIWTIPVMYQGGFINTSNYGYGTFLPTYGFTSCLPYNNYVYSGTCYPCAAGLMMCTNNRRIPGIGAMWVSAFGGTTGMYGDTSAAGLVRVTWVC